MDQKSTTVMRLAHRMGWSYHRALNAVLRAEVKGWQDADGRWHVDAVDLERLAQGREAVVA